MWYHISDTTFCSELIHLLLRHGVSGGVAEGPGRDEGYQAPVWMCFWEHSQLPRCCPLPSCPECSSPASIPWEPLSTECLLDPVLSGNLPVCQYISGHLEKLSYLTQPMAHPLLPVHIISCTAPQSSKFFTTAPCPVSQDRCSGNNSSKKAGKQRMRFWESSPRNVKKIFIFQKITFLPFPHSFFDKSFSIYSQHFLMHSPSPSLLGSYFPLLTMLPYGSIIQRFLNMYYNGPEK